MALFFIIIFFWSCTNTEFQNLNEGVKFINVLMKILMILMKKFTGVYISNIYKKICLYIKNDTKFLEKFR